MATKLSSIHRPGELQPAVGLPMRVQVQLLGHLLHEMLRHVVLTVPDRQEQRPRHLLQQLAVQVAAAESPNPPPCCSHGQHEDLYSGDTVWHGKAQKHGMLWTYLGTKGMFGSLPWFSDLNDQQVT